MSAGNGTRRSYNSRRRQEQARQTRARIVEGARRLFVERGYSGATIEAMADAAGVAPETVYAIFGSKLAVLNALVQTSLTGDDLPIPLLQREHVLAAMKETSQGVIIRNFAADIYRIMSQMAPVFGILNSAAPVEPEIAAFLEKILTDRLAGMTYLVDQVARTGPLREGLTRQKAAEAVWAVSSAEVFQLLTLRRGWSRETYTAWLADSVSRLLLP